MPLRFTNRSLVWFCEGPHNILRNHNRYHFSIIHSLLVHYDPLSGIFGVIYDHGFRFRYYCSHSFLHFRYGPKNKWAYFTSRQFGPVVMSIGITIVRP